MERFEIVVDDEGNYCGLIPSENGPLVQLTDAQATIAALQARVQELEDGTSALLNQQSERLAVENEKLTMALSQLTQRTVERDTARRRVDELEAREVDVVTLREDLEQRTAELERVSLLSSHNERRFEEVDKKYKELRTLIAALPKVEGDVEVSSGVYNFILLKHDSGNRFLCGQIETEQTAKAIAALWQHRQGMEG